MIPPESSPLSNFRGALKPKGLFLESGKEGKCPTYAGVLAFKRIDIMRKSDPVIYHHPRFTGELPMQMMNFEQRRFQHASQIIIQPAKRQNILENLYAVSDLL